MIEDLCNLCNAQEEPRVLSLEEAHDTVEWMVLERANVAQAGVNLLATIEHLELINSQQAKALNLSLEELIADKTGINMRMSGAGGKNFVAALVRFFRDNGGKNFVTMTIEMQGHKYSINIQNLHGELSMAEKLDKAESDRAFLLKEMQWTADQIDGDYVEWELENMTLMKLLRDNAREVVQKVQGNE